MLRTIKRNFYITLTFFVLGLMVIYLFFLREKEYTDYFVSNFFRTESSEQIAEFDRDALSGFIDEQNRLTLASYYRESGEMKLFMKNVDLPISMYKGRFFNNTDFGEKVCVLGYSYNETDIGTMKNGFKVIGILDSKYSDLEKFVIESASESDLLNKGFLTIDTFEPSNEELSSFSEVVTQSTPPFMFTRDSNLYTFLSIFILNYILLLTYFLTERKHEIKLRHIFGHSKWITSIDFTLKFSVFATLGLTMSYIMSYILDVDINTYLFISSVALIFISTFIINYIFLIREERSL